MCSVAAEGLSAPSTKSGNVAIRPGRALPRACGMPAPTYVYGASARVVAAVKNGQIKVETNSTKSP